MCKPWRPPLRFIGLCRSHESERQRISKKNYEGIGKESSWASKYSARFRTRKTKSKRLGTTEIPVWIPMPVSCSWWSGKWRTLRKNMWLSNSRAMLVISPACLMAIQLRATADHNVRITNSRDLKDNVMFWGSSWPLLFLTFSVKMAPKYPSHSGANKGSLSSCRWS